MERYRSEHYHALEAVCLSDLGCVARATHDTVRALQLYAEAVVVAGHTEDPTVTLTALEGFALALAGAGDGPRAGRTLRPADALREGGVHPWDPNVDDRNAASEAVSALVGEEALVAMRAEGRIASIESLVEGVVA